MKLALIGSSKIANKIVPAIKDHSTIEICGLASSNTERGRVAASSLGLEFLGKYADVFSNPLIDAVYISTLNAQHEQCVADALNAGKHVLCEKPLVLSGSAASRLFSLAQSKNLILMEGLMYRFHPQISALLNEIRSLKYGRVQRFDGTLSFNYGVSADIDRRLKNSGGAAADLGCYLVDFVNLLANGAAVKNVERRSNSADLRNFSATIEFDSGFVAVISSSMDRPSLNLWEIACESAALSIKRYNPHEVASSEICIIDDESELSILPVTADGSGLNQFVAEFENFFQAVHSGKPPFITAEQSIANAELLERLLS
jgi:xylose dehydrogenase (NAD/NADP)